MPSPSTQPKKKRPTAAERKRREAQAAKTKAAKAAEGTPPAENPQAPANGVLIIRDVAENGDIGVNVQGLGDVKLTEIPTVIRLGLKFINQQLGFDD